MMEMEMWKRVVDKHFCVPLMALSEALHVSASMITTITTIRQSIYHHTIHGTIEPIFPPLSSPPPHSTHLRNQRDALSWQTPSLIFIAGPATALTYIDTWHSFLCLNILCIVMWSGKKGRGALVTVGDRTAAVVGRALRIEQ